MTNKIADYYEQNAGANARKGFKFQDYVGVYYMLYYYKNDIDFSVYFETRDDLETISSVDKNKIQVKSNKFTCNKIHSCKNGKKSVYDKLMDSSDNKYDRHILSCFGFNENEYNNYLHKTDFDLNNVYSISGHNVYSFDPKFNIHLVPFNDNFENAEYYILGYAKDDTYGKIIDLDKHIDKLIKRVGELGEYKIEAASDYERKKLTYDNLKSIDCVNKKIARRDKILDAIAFETNYEFADSIKLKMNTLVVNPDPLLLPLESYNFKNIGAMRYKDYFFDIISDIKSLINVDDDELLLAWSIKTYIDEVA